MASVASRSALVDAARDLNKVLDLSPAINERLGVGPLRDSVAEAVCLLKIDDLDKLEVGTRHVIAGLRSAVVEIMPRLVEKGADFDREAVRQVLDAVTDESDAGEPDGSADGIDNEKTASPKTKKTKKAQKVAKDKLGKFSPVRDNGGAFSKILRAHLDGNAPTIAEAAAVAGVDRDKAEAALRRARISSGIDHEISEDGTLSIALPSGIDAESVWHRPKEKQVVPSSTEKSRYGAADVIVLKVDKNPKQTGSAAHGRFEFYRDGMTCEQFLAAGGSRADLSWDKSHGFIEIRASA